jgi:outer membrane protein assembly factor BamB
MMTPFFSAGPDSRGNPHPVPLFIRVAVEHAREVWGLRSLPPRADFFPRLLGRVSLHLLYGMVVLGGGLAMSGLAWAQTPAAEVEQLACGLLDQAAFHGGVIAHVGCGDGTLTAAVMAAAVSRQASEAERSQASGGDVLLLALDEQEDQVTRARAAVAAAGQLGRANVARFDGTQLPFIDNLVNLVILERPVPEAEVMRVLCPGGIALMRPDRATEPGPGAWGGGWQKLVKPRPRSIDEWTHYFHDASGNPVAHDTEVGPPRHLQWVAHPRWSRHHDRMASMTSLVSAAGRLYLIHDEGSRVSIELPAHWQLVARDAFNGTLLWKRPIPNWHDHMWPLKSGPTQLARRLVAAGDDLFVTLGLHAPVSRLDGRTGLTKVSYEGTESTEELLHDRGLLVCLINHGRSELADFTPAMRVGDQGRVAKDFLWNGEPREVRAIDAASGQLLWSHTGRVVPLTLTMDGERVVWHDGEKLVCHDRRTGMQRWASGAAPRRKSLPFHFAPRLVLHDTVALYAGGEGKMQSYSLDDGRLLWESAHAPSGYQSPQDVIVTGGLVWVAPTTSTSDTGIYVGRDPLTGDVKKEFPPDVDTYWFHHRCHIAKATDRFIIPSRTGIEFVDFNASHWDINHWVRGGCLYGVLPCNGLLYAPPHDCACYPEAKLSGFNALAPERPSAAVEPVPDKERIVFGPAYGQPVDESEDAAGDWPTYRHDARRSGSTPGPLPRQPQPLWTAELSGRLSPPVVAAGRVYVVAIDAHTVHVFDAASGKPLWKHAAGGRIDSPPTVWKGRVLFGSTDGFVTCLRATDGQLLWRYFAAPADRRLTAFDQLESVWPVHGTILIEHDAAHFIVGRSCFLDGGMQYVRIDPRTGSEIAVTRIDATDPTSGGGLQDRIQTLQMPAGLSDILSSDGERIYLRSQAFEMDGRRTNLGPVSGDPATQGSTQAGAGRHLFAPMGYLDDTWFHRSYWVYGRNFAGGHSGYWQAGKYTPGGRILCFDDETVYGYARMPEYYRWTTPLEHQLYAASLDAAVETVQTSPARRPKGKQAEANLISFPRSEPLDPAGRPVSISLWIKPEQPGGVILAHGGSVNGYAVALRQRQPVFSVRAGQTLGRIEGDRRLGDGWNHLVCQQKDDGSLEIILNGERVASGPGPGLIPRNPNDPLDIGGDSGSLVDEDLFAAANNQPRFAGSIDELRIAHATLTLEAARAIHEDPAAAVGPAALLCLFDSGDARDTSRPDGASPPLGDLPTAQGRRGEAVVFPKRVSRQTTAESKAIGASGLGFEQKWTRFVPLFARAMVVGKGMIAVAGPPDLVDSEKALEGLAVRDREMVSQLERQDAALAGGEGGLLRILSTADGSHIFDTATDFLPVWDGMIAAGDRLFVTTTDGRLICQGSQP